jgi:hypothetical protein
MDTDTTHNPPHTDTADIEALRRKFMGGLTPFDDFARAIGKHPKTVARMRPPIVRVGRQPYVPDDEGRAWILGGCKPWRPENPRGRGRRGAA